MLFYFRIILLSEILFLLFIAAEGEDIKAQISFSGFEFVCCLWQSRQCRKKMKTRHLIAIRPATTRCCLLSRIASLIRIQWVRTSLKLEANEMKSWLKRGNNKLKKELEYAAMSSRLPHDKMTMDEMKHFSDIVDESSLSSRSQIENYKTFIYLRNRIVIWTFKDFNHHSSFFLQI